jgi:hypothetical protein
MANVDIRTPATHKQAMKTPQAAEWAAAEQSELESFRTNDVLTPVVLPPGVNPLATRWVYRIKYDAQGAIKSYKARLVAKGYEKVHGVDYDQTYSPVSRLTSIRLLLALSAKLNLQVHQMDVDTAFLNAPLTENVYIIPPDGVTVPDGFNGFKVNRALNGLKQAPQE